MAIVYNTNFEIRAPFPIDEQRGWVQLYSDLDSIRYKHEGLQTWVVSTRSSYVYYDNIWHLFYTDTDVSVPPMSAATDKMLLTNDGTDALWTDTLEDVNMDAGYF